MIDLEGVRITFSDNREFTAKRVKISLYVIAIVVVAVMLTLIAMNVLK